MTLLDFLEKASEPTADHALPRTPTAPGVRRLVFMRDGFTCRWCGNIATARAAGIPVDESQPAPFHLDHIVPHSAGGCDHAHNLRVLCRGCNEVRSNRLTDSHARAVPVTPCCKPCEWRERDLLDDDEHDELPDVGARFAAFCGRCCSTSWTDDKGMLL